MKVFRYVALAVASAAALSCSHSARIDGTVVDYPQSPVIVKLLDVNTYKVLDTVMTDAAGRFSCKVAVEKGEPEFVYAFKGDTKIASAVVQPGDRLVVKTDTLGRYDVEGSEESLLLKDVELAYASFLDDVAKAMAPLSPTADGTVNADVVSREVSSLYLQYYRKALSFIMKHPHSITSVPVCFQTVTEGFPVFNTNTDAIRFRALADSLGTVYPESKYVKALVRETERREKMLALDANIRSAQPSGFPDIILSDMQGQKSALSSVDSKVVLLHFWSASDAQQKLFNQDVLKPVYAKYHDKGFEIYSVSLDADKSTWASVVKAQQLPWVNVCDTRGAVSPYVATYNVTSLPLSYIICDGELKGDKISDAKGLEAFLAKNLK